MDTLINLLALFDIMLAIVLTVVSFARMDRDYTARVRAEMERKAILRGEDKF